jgi:hypothetical protein
MESLLDDRNPETCLSMGLDCRNCVRHSAEAVAGICRGLTSTGVASLFVQLFPAPGCAHMSLAFQAAYVDASVPRKPIARAIAAA